MLCGECVARRTRIAQTDPFGEFLDKVLATDPGGGDSQLCRGWGRRPHMFVWRRLSGAADAVTVVVVGLDPMMVEEEFLWRSA